MCHVKIKSMCFAAAASEPSHDDDTTDHTAAAEEADAAAGLVNPEASEAAGNPEADAAADADGQEAAEKAAPAIPAEIPDKILLQRLADRSAVNAPSDAIGRSTLCATPCLSLDIQHHHGCASTSVLLDHSALLYIQIAEAS